jgi:hypothetical protein
MEVPAENLAYFRLPLLQGSIAMWSQSPRTKEGTW